MTLYAVPNQKVAFLYWQIVGESGTTTRLDNPLELSITEDVTITAVFTDNVVNGVAVSAVGGGEVRMGGYDETSTTTNLSAVCFSGYQFVGWFLGDAAEPFSMQMSITINLAEMDGKQIIAKFELLDNSHINDDTNN